MTNEEKIYRLTEQVASSQARMEATMDAMREDAAQDRARIASLEHWRNGNGTVGISTRVDRLEQGAERSTRWVKTLVGGVVGVGVGFLMLVVERLWF